MLQELKEIRKNNGFTQEKVANELGIKKSTYSRKETGKIPFALEEVKSISTLLRLDGNQIIKIFLS